MEDISIALDISEGFQYLNEFRCPSIKYQETGNVYVYLKFPDDSVDTIGNVIISIYIFYCFYSFDILLFQQVLLPK